MYLNELVQDASLDFFVLFSSVTCIAGNRGQSAYTAANMFMSALATQRRAKGLAASILHIGAVMGVGYVNRAFSNSILTALRKTGYMMMSEREFQLCFGEAVVASHPLSGRSPEVVTALGAIQLGADLNPPWAKFPRFQFCIKADEGGDKKAKRKTAAVSAKVQLLDATTPDEVLEIVSGKFVMKLGRK
jgi:hybrid polyketide synthase/nonribosomal peptide synthetase ACE1